MKLALFTDATVHIPTQRAAVGAVCFDVASPLEPIELFCLSNPIPFCGPNMAETLAALRGLERVLALVRDEGTRPRSLLLFTDSTSVAASANVTRAGDVTKLESLGCPVTFHHVPRCLNRAAHRAAHDALYPPHPDMLVPREIPATHAPLIAQFPFLPYVNA